MTKIFTYEYIKNFIEIESNSGCTLLTSKEKYINTAQNIDIKCKCGEIFSTSFSKFSRRNKQKCNYCSGNTYSFEKVKLDIEKNELVLITTKEEYVGTTKKISVRCICGIIFSTTYNDIVNRNKTQCNECSGIHEYTIDEVRYFVEVESGSGCELISNQYINREKKLKMKCKCGNIFEAPFDGFKTKYQRQCKSCGINKRINKLAIKYDKIKEFIEIESLSNCTLITKENEYGNTYSKLTIRCECGELFILSYSQFKSFQQYKCSKCTNYYRANIDDIKLWLKENADDYSLLSNEYRSVSEKLNFQCSEGHNFKTTWNHFKNDDSRCPICNGSKGELKILNYLKKTELDYEYLYRESSCVYKKPLIFDFAIFKTDRRSIDIVIEFNGRQHYEEVNFGNMRDEDVKQTFIEQKIKDQIKRDYCNNNNIKLIEIPHWDFKIIDKILHKEVFDIGVN